MEFRRLGQTDLNVSVISLGTMTWGEQNNEAEGHAQLDYALSQGVNFIDTAELYPVPPSASTYGQTEKIIGSWLKKRQKRDDVVIATKIAGPDRSGESYIRSGSRFNSEHIRKACEDSLNRLQTDYIDLYQLHWPERSVNSFGKLGLSKLDEKDLTAIPLQETLFALQELVDSGKVRYIGLSNETPWGVCECLRLSDFLDVPRVVSIQNPYNLLNRSFEVGLAEIALREECGLLAYSPLAFGILSGKYLNNQRPIGARLSMFDRFSRYANPNAELATQKYLAIAQEAGIELSQMALAFVNQQAFVTSNIIGATNLSQLESNIKSVDLNLSDEIIKQINQVHAQISNPCP